MTVMSGNSSTAAQFGKFIQYAQVIPVLSAMKQKQKDTYDQRLQQVLSSWKFSKISVPRDGNCFFTSVALELSYFSPETVEQLGLSHAAPITELVARLRTLIVEEWMGTQRHIYEEFITDTSQFEFWANLFKQNYFYDCELGNTMPLAMANALSVSFVVFTSHECSSPYYVTPYSVVSCIQLTWKWTL